MRRSLTFISPGPCLQGVPPYSWRHIADSGEPIYVKNRSKPYTRHQRDRVI